MVAHSGRDIELFWLSAWLKPCPDTNCSGYPCPKAALCAAVLISNKQGSDANFASPTSPCFRVPGLPSQITQYCAFSSSSWTSSTDPSRTADVNPVITMPLVLMFLVRAGCAKGCEDEFTPQTRIGNSAETRVCRRRSIVMLLEYYCDWTGWETYPSYPAVFLKLLSSWSRSPVRADRRNSHMGRQMEPLKTMLPLLIQQTPKAAAPTCGSGTSDKMPSGFHKRWFQTGGRTLCRCTQKWA